MVAPGPSSSPASTHRSGEANSGADAGPRTLAIDVGGSNIEANPGITIIDNQAAIEGGLRVWRD